MKSKPELFFLWLRTRTEDGAFVELNLGRAGWWWITYDKVTLGFACWKDLKHWRPGQARYRCPKCASYVDLAGRQGSCPECAWHGRVKLRYEITQTH